MAHLYQVSVFSHVRRYLCALHRFGFLRKLLSPDKIPFSTTAFFHKTSCFASTQVSTMAPKAAANVDSLDGASVKFLLTALKSCSEFAPDWDQVAKEHDIKYARNAYVLCRLAAIKQSS